MHSLKQIEASGGLVIDRQERILFIFKGGRWDLPKGLIERGEEASDVAAKEVSEETGLPLDSLHVVSELIPTCHISKFGKEKSIKRTRWFLLQFLGKETPFNPQVSEGIEHCDWVPLWDLDRPLANCPARIRYLIAFWQKVRRECELPFDRF